MIETGKPSGAPARKHERYAVNLNVKVRILIPEDTFSPRELDGQSIDVSERGMQVSLDALSLDLYTKLLARPRYVRIAFTPGGQMEPIKLTGRLAWIDYHKPKASEESGQCRVGVFFDDSEGIDPTEYVEFLRGLKAA